MFSTLYTPSLQHPIRRGILIVLALCVLILVAVKSQPIFADDVPPTLDFSTYFGGSGYSEAEDVAVDPQGNIYVVGHTTTNTFPATNPFGLSLPNSTELIYVTKFDPTATNVLYSVFLGVGIGSAIEVDADGYAYVTGEATGVIPIKNAIQSSLKGTDDAFIIRLSPSGQTAVYSTYLGGSAYDLAYGMGLDANRNVYIAGVTNSTDYPTLDAAQSTMGGPSDTIIAKLNSSGALVYSTYYGGTGKDISYDITVSPAGDAYFTGYTESTDWPTLHPFQAAHANPCASLCWDAFATKFDTSGAPAYSTYLGGDGGEESGLGVTVDASGSLYVTGVTISHNFPTHNPYQATNTSMYDAAFVTKFSPDGSELVYSTYLNGSGQDNAGYSIAVDTDGRAYVGGFTDALDFPTVNAIQSTRGGTNPINPNDAFLTQFSADGQSLLFSTYLGGSHDDGLSGLGLTYDSKGSVIVAGVTRSSDFPLKNPYQSTGGGTGMSAPTTAFLAKINFGIVPPPEETPDPTQVVPTAIPTSAPAADADRNYFTTDTPTLTWTPITWATHYHVQVSQDKLFKATPDFDGVTVGNELSITTNHLDDGFYYWRVQAQKADGSWGSYSPIESFTVEAN